MSATDDILNLIDGGVQLVGQRAGRRLRDVVLGEHRAIHADEGSHQLGVHRRVKALEVKPWVLDRPKS